MAAWLDAKTFDEEKAAIRRLNKAALECLVYAPTGFFLQYQAWRKNVTGIVKGSMYSREGSRDSPAAVDGRPALSRVRGYPGTFGSWFIALVAARGPGN